MPSIGRPSRRNPNTTGVSHLLTRRSQRCRTCWQRTGEAQDVLPGLARSPLALTQATLGSESGLCSAKHSQWQVEQALANSEQTGQVGIPGHQPGKDTQPAPDQEESRTPPLAFLCLEQASKTQP